MRLMDASPDAFSLIAGMLRRSSATSPSFSPTELFSEGWMLRLPFESGFGGHGGLPLEIAPDAVWYSEARLASPFLPQMQPLSH